MRLPLSQGYFAEIDEEDAHLAAFKWCADVQPNGRVYAMRRNPSGPDWRLHRCILGVTARQIDVDHIDGDGLNCRRSNLRAVPRRLNAINVTGERTGHSLPLGVHLFKRTGKYQAYITRDGQRHSLGYFESPSAANMARLHKEKELWGIQPRRRWAFEEAGLC